MLILQWLAFLSVTTPLTVSARMPEDDVQCGFPLLVQLPLELHVTCECRNFFAAVDWLMASAVATVVTSPSAVRPVTTPAVIMRLRILPPRDRRTWRCRPSQRGGRPGQALCTREGHDVHKQDRQVRR